MPRVDIMLNGRTHTVACRDGEEQRLLEIAGYVDGKLRTLAAASPGGSEVQIMMLASLMLADELLDARAALAAAQAGSAERGEDERVVAAVDQLARRIEDIAARLERV